MGRGKPCKQRRKKSFWGEKPSPRESSRNPFSCVGARGTGQTLHPLSMGCGQSCQPSTARYRDLPAPCSLGTITHVKFPDKNLLCLIFPFPETNEYPVKNLGCHSPSCAFVQKHYGDEQPLDGTSILLQPRHPTATKVQDVPLIPRRHSKRMKCYLSVCF